ncbi:hypothetical protein D046_4189 [Vibrio parahaemolyticus V-223/04]|nr:hypothetical protein D046_4189 [Vibrio parahaemolyticus V-223/04]
MVHQAHEIQINDKLSLNLDPLNDFRYPVLFAVELPSWWGSQEAL